MESLLFVTQHLVCRDDSLLRVRKGVLLPHSPVSSPFVFVFCLCYFVSPCNHDLPSPVLSGHIAIIFCTEGRSFAQLHSLFTFCFWFLFVLLFFFCTCNHDLPSHVLFGRIAIIFTRFPIIQTLEQARDNDTGRKIVQKMTPKDRDNV